MEIRNIAVMDNVSGRGQGTYSCHYWDSPNCFLFRGTVPIVLFLPLRITFGSFNENAL